jgi:hypothetical protein
MNSTKTLAHIYEIVLSEVGRDDAKKTVSGVLMSVLTELERANVPVNEANLSKALDFVAEKFTKAAGKQLS